MNLKIFTRRIISISLCIISIIVSIFSFPFTVYASDPIIMGNVDTVLLDATEKAWTTGDWSDVQEIMRTRLSIIKAILLGTGAIAEGDALLAVSSTESVLDAIPNNVSVDSNGDFVFGTDLIKAIKQALKEYQNEQYGYQILPTLKYDQIPVSSFSSSTEYRTMCELAKTYGYIAMYLPSTSATFSVCDVSAYSDNTAGFYIKEYGSDYIEVKLMDYITWADVQENYYTYDPDDAITLPDVCTTFEELQNYIEATDGWCNGVKSGQYWLKISQFNLSGNLIVSYTGSDVLVFNNATSLKNYSIDKRGVFTTKDFYEDTGELTLKLDDLNNSIGDLTDLLEQFKDLLGKQDGGLTEEQLQKLLKDFLDEFFNRLGEKEDDNGGGSSSGGNSGGISSGDIKDGILDALSGYYEAILSYLDGILYEIQNLELITLTTGGSSSGDDSTDLLDWFNDVWKDPENNAQEFADKLEQPFSEIASGITKKFPFSIPWDVYGFFTILSGVNPPQNNKTYSLNSDNTGDTTENLENIKTTASVYSVDSNGNEHSAPYFELPIVVERFGIKEYIVVDLKDFQAISTLSRTMLALLFGVFLMKFTIRIVDLFKGGSDS